MTRRRGGGPARLAAVGVLLAAGVVVPAGPAEAAVPGEFIFVQTPNRYDYFLYAASGSTGARRRISSHRAVGRPSLSPGGSKIVFSGPLNNDDTLGRYALYVVGRDGKGLRRLSVAKFAHWDPAWSPDGRTIAVTRDLRGNSESTCCSIALVNPDGTRWRSVPNTDRGTFPSWSPDSRRLAFIRPDGLYVINRGGTGRRRLVAGTVRTPAWSPDGASIAYSQRVDETHSRVRVVPAAGGTPTTRWRPSGHAESPVWGADGQTLFAVYHRGWGDWARTSSAVYRIPVSGSASKQWNHAYQIYFLDYHSGLPNPGTDGVGRVSSSPAGLSWRVLNGLAMPAVEPTPFVYGIPGDRPVTGDWDRDGVDTAGFVRADNGELFWHLSDGVTAPFAFGVPSDIPVAGDWNGDGVDSPGLVRISGDRLVWYFRSRNVSPASVTTLTFGSVIDGVPDIPVTGDWDGDGFASIGVTRVSGTELRWFLNNSSSSYAIDYDFRFGAADDRPVAGDWDGDRHDTPGVTRVTSGDELEWSVRNSNSDGSPDTTFVWGTSTDLPVTGDWDGA